MISTKPILVNDLFPKLNAELLKLLSETPDEKWYNATVCEGWDVKDIVQHLLKDYILLISRKRDNYRHPMITDKKFENNADLVKFIAELNQSWVDTMKTLSPRMLIELLDFSGTKLFDYFNTVDLMKVEAGVSWISADRLPNWTDVAREYTEHWLHQAQIRDALGAPLLVSKELFHPFISAYMLAIPKTYKEVSAQLGTKIQISVNGEAGGDWYLEKVENEWNLCDGVANDYESSISIDQDTLWRLFSKGMEKEDAKQKVKISGDIELGEVILNTLSLIA